ncbi:MAG: SDR family NAD(P)-dependent oxidoreductase [Pseudomonadota bacterium]
MRAGVFHKHGPCDSIRVEELPEPEIGPKDVLLRVRAASLNGFDPMIVQGTTQLKTPLPMIPGGDCAGEVVRVGAEVSGWQKGDAVLPFPMVPGEGMTGEVRIGVCSEYTRFPADNLIRIPDGVSYEDAACLPIAYGTAWRLVEERARIAAGEKVLILGATGGVGTCLVQLCKAKGAHVIACGSSAKKLEQLSDLGADEVIDTSSADVVDEIWSRHGKPRVFGSSGGVDVVVNYIGGDTWVPALKTLRRNGRMVTCGATAGFEPQTDIRYIWSFELSIIGSNGWTPGDQKELLDAVHDKQVKPIIDRVVDLEGTGQAMQDLFDRKVFGKIVVVP